MNWFVLSTFDARHNHIGTTKSKLQFPHLNTQSKTLIKLKKKTARTDRIEFYFCVNIHRNRHQADLLILTCVRVERNSLKRRSSYAYCGYTYLPDGGGDLFGKKLFNTTVDWEIKVRNNVSNLTDLP